MSRSRVKFCSSLVLMSAVGALPGCGGDGSGDSKGKWLEGVAAQGLYEAEVYVSAVNAGADPFTADKSCKVIVGLARESLSDPGKYITGIQAMAKPCNTAGLEFANKVRCDAGRLQVMCR